MRESKEEKEKGRHVRERSVIESGRERKRVRLELWSDKRRNRREGEAGEDSTAGRPVE